MAIEIFPVPVASSLNSKSVTCTTSGTLYEARMPLTSGTYTVTTSSNDAYIRFYSSAIDLVLQTNTSSSTVTFSLATTCDRFRVWTSGGSNVVVTITKVAEALSNVFSGTLDTITSTGTYNGTSTSGYGYVILAGAGGGGSGGLSQNGTYGGAGGGGGVAGKIIQLTGSMAVTIGAPGNGGNMGTNIGTANSGNAGGSSNFSNLVAGGGGGGLPLTNNNAGDPVRGTAGSASGGEINNPGAGVGGGDAGRYEGGGPGASPYPFAVSSIGSSGGSSRAGNLGIGTGYGVGGGGTQPYTSNNGKVGTAGVLYVLRF